MKVRWRAYVCTLALMGFACASSDDDDGSPPPAADTGVNVPSDSGMVVEDSGVETPDAGTPADTGTTPVDAGPPPDDGNNDFASAEEIQIGARDIEDEINPAGDRDFFRFLGTAGEWISINVTASGSQQSETVDPVVRVYDSNQTQIAENDDGQPRTSVNSEVIFQIPTSGTYFIEVIEWSDWAGETEEGSFNYDYELLVLRLTADSNQFLTEDPETGDTLNDAAPLDRTNGNFFDVVYGNYRDAADVDVYRFTIPAGGVRSYRLIRMPVGTDGYGSTTAGGEMWISDVTGSTVTAKVDQAILPAMSSPLEGGQYLLWVKSSSAALGNNPFYVIKHQTAQENLPEMGDGTNEVITGAEQLTLEGMDPRAAFLLARIPGGDVDYFRFDVPANETLSVACGARSAGSGVRGLTIEVRDGNDQTFAMGTETGTSGVALTNLTVTSTTWYLRLSKTGQAPDIQGNWVRCAVRTAP